MVRFPQRLAEAAAAPSGGTTGVFYENALAKQFNLVLEAELVHNKGPRQSTDDLEIGTPGYLDWFNYRSLRSEIGLIPATEHETNHHRHTSTQAPVEASVPSPH